MIEFNPIYKVWLCLIEKFFNVVQLHTCMDTWDKVTRRPELKCWKLSTCNYEE